MKVEELKKRLQENGDDVVMFDIRERNEAAMSGEKIEGSENLPMVELLEAEREGKLPKDKKIITICKSGGRCELVAQQLSGKGYDIEYLEGGIDEYKKQS